MNQETLPRLLGRLPDLQIGHYMSRWWLFPRNEVFNLYVHRLVESDEPTLHDHPAFNISVVLKGAYLEHFHDGTVRRRGPGDIVFRTASQLHWLEVLDGPVWTVWVRGRTSRRWGFMTNGHWRPWQFHKTQRPGRTWSPSGRGHIYE